MTTASKTTALVAAGLALLLAVTFHAYTAGLPGFFQLDDFTIPRYAPDSTTWHELTDNIADGRFGGISRSLTKLTYALTLGTSGFRSEVFKTHNIYLHLANGLLVFWLALLLSSCTHKPGTTALFIAFGVAAVWMLHPIQVSTVLYPVQRYVLLATLFTLAALIAYTKARTTSGQSLTRQILLYFLAFAVFWPLALLSKETAALLPLYILAVEFFVLRFAATSPVSRGLLGAILLVFVAAPLMAAAAYFFYSHESLLAGYAGRLFDLEERLLTELQVLGFYLKLILLPIPSTMSLYHENFPIVRELHWPTLFAAAFWLGLILLALRLRRTTPLFGLGVAVFLFAHALESTVIPLELVFEHRNYLAVFGIALAAAGLLASIRHTAIIRLTGGVAVTALIALLAFNTFVRAHAWSDRELLVQLEYRDNPASHRLLEQMAMLEFRRGNKAAGRSYLREIVRRYPSLAAPHLIEIRTYCSSNEIPAEVVTQAARKLDTGPLTAFDGNALLTLTNKVLKDKCLPMRLDDLRQLTIAAAQNRRVHTPSVHLSALVNAARVSAASGMPQASRKWTFVAVETAAGLGLQRFKKTVEELASIQAVLGKPGDLEQFLDEITRRHRDFLMENELSLNVAAAPRNTASSGTTR